MNLVTIRQKLLLDTIFCQCLEYKCIELFTPYVWGLKLHQILLAYIELVHSLHQTLIFSRFKANYAQKY